MGEWKETTLKEVAAIDTGYAFKGDRYTDSGSLRVVRGMNVTIKDLRWGSDAKYWEHGTSGLEKYFLRESDIVIGMDGSRIGENRAMVKAHDLPSILAQRVARIRCIPDVTDQDFLWQVIAAENFVAFIKAIFTGTSIPHISQGQLGSYELRLPPLPEQRAIASVLSSLDAKIDLLHRQNKTLEAMAQTLFRQWFVEEAEEGWAWTQLGEHVKVHRGLSYTGAGLCEKGEGVPMHNLNSVYEGGGYKYDGIKYYKGEYKDRHILRPGDVIVTNTEQGHDQLLIGCSAIVPVYFGDEGIYSQHVYKLEILNPAFSNVFLAQLILTAELREQITGATNGSTVNMLPTDGLEWAKFKMPPQQKIKQFNAIAAPLHQKQEKNYIQTQTLIAQRDTLLPKLMSGEVRVTVP